MGLDMYLRAKKYVGGWKHNPEPMFAELVRITGMTPTEDSPSFHVEATVGYWRKANAIHKWFVDNVQDGEDNCQESYVEREQLQSLRDLCQSVIDASDIAPGTLNTGTTFHGDGRIENHTALGVVVANPEIAAQNLPTESGFFFGGTDYDEGYLQDLRDTIVIIDRVLADPAMKDCDFYYHASW